MWLGVYGIRRIDEHANANGFGHQLVQEREPLGLHLLGEKIEAGRVPARLGEACHKAELDRVLTNGEGDRDRCGCRSRRDRGYIARRGDHGDAPTGKVGHHRRKAVELAVQDMIFDGHVPPLAVAGFA
jgi:hypothetical protein